MSLAEIFAQLTAITFNTNSQTMANVNGKQPSPSVTMIKLPTPTKLTEVTVLRELTFQIT